MDRPNQMRPYELDVMDDVQPQRRQRLDCGFISQLLLLWLDVFLEKETEVIDDYRRLFGTSEVILQSGSGGISVRDDIYDFSIEVSGIDLCLRYLETFGRLIKKLRFGYPGFRRAETEVLYEIIGRNTDNSMRLKLWGMRFNDGSSLPIEAFGNPLPNVIILKITGNDLD